MKYSVCIDAVFNEKDFIKSMKTINEIGIKSFEFWSYWDKNIDDILEVKELLNMNIVAFCTRFISLVDENKRSEYLEGLKASIKIAKKLGCTKLITQVGDQLENIPRQEQKKSIVAGLKACIPYLERAKITLVIEPLNILVDHKGYYLSNSKEAFDIAKEVNSPYVKVLYDIYHQQITEGNIISTITNNIDLIGHFHAAGSLGRHELDNGEINYIEVFKAIKKTLFEGYMGLEYFPIKEASIGLKELLENR